MRGARALTAGAALAMVAAACAPRVTVSLPTGGGRPDTRAVAAYDALQVRCAAVRTWSAEIGVAGTVRGQRLRLRVLAATTADGGVRLEGVAPFGAPWFVLVATGDDAVLLLPRESRVLRDATTAQVLDALVGLPLSGEDLHALLSGCGVSPGDAANGRAYDGGWLAVDVGSGRVLFFREAGAAARLDGARIGPLSVGYVPADPGATVGRLQLVDARGGDRGGVRLQLTFSQSEENTPLPAGAFTLRVPDNARPLGLDELRARGLGAGEG
jgi:hypothetical protein